MSEGKKKRFGNLAAEDVCQEQISQQNVNTVKSEQKAVNAFKNYLDEIDLEDTDF